MIAGIGLDVVDVPGFTRQLAEPHTAFVEQTFTAAEQEVAGAGPGDRATRLAARFAAKEAFVKAWSAARTGQAPALEALDLRDVEVVGDAWGRPRLSLHGALARAVVASLGETRTHLSISHDGPLAAAVVVIEADL